jgi:hypothetical protein
MNQQEKPKTPGIAIAALICALLFFVPLLPIVGLILGIVAAVKISSSKGRLGGAGVAYAAIAVGAFSVIASIGMMAAIAIPAVVKYQTRAKQAEVRITLMSLRTGAIGYAERVRDASGKPHFPPGSTDWIPAGPCGVSGCGLVDPAKLMASPWSDLGFIPPPRPRFQYRYRSTDPENRSFEAEAQADLDGDGKMETWSMKGQIGSDGEPVIDQPKPDTGGEL